MSIDDYDEVPNQYGVREKHNGVGAHHNGLTPGNTTTTTV
jgi:hypothetical protein